LFLSYVLIKYFLGTTKFREHKTFEATLPPNAPRCYEPDLVTVKVDIDITLYGLLKRLTSLLC